jgi:ribosomal protein S18 acetylase RimI-like enzyme
VVEARLGPHNASHPRTPIRDPDPHAFAVRMTDATIRLAGPDDHAALLAVARTLPQWFTEGGLRMMALDFPYQRCLAAVEAEAVIGFLSYFVHEGVARIGWMGVELDLRRRGVGRALVEHMLADLRADGVPEVRVSTLGDGVEYEPYAETRAFYRSVGFTDFECVQLDNPECPEQLTLSLRLDGPV